jgi:hypothetical protein
VLQLAITTLASECKQNPKDYCGCSETDQYKDASNRTRIFEEADAKMSWVLPDGSQLTMSLESCYGRPGSELGLF